MRVAINLASRPFADLAPALKKLRIAMGVLALVAVGLGIGLYAIQNKAAEARARAHSLDGKIAQVQQERQRYRAMMQQPENARTLQRSEMLNQLIDEKSFSWTLAMEDLETVLPAGVQVQTLEPTVKNGQISVRLRVLGPRDRDVELVQNLEHSRHFMMPRIVGEAAESTGTPGQPQPVSAGNRVDFDIQADYAPGSAEERKQAHEKSTHAKKGETGSAESNTGSQHNRISRPKAPIAHYPGVPQ